MDSLNTKEFRRLKKHYTKMPLDYLWKLYEEDNPVKKEYKDGDAGARIALLSVIEEKAISNQKNAIFSKRQAAAIMWATIVIAFFTAYPTVVKWKVPIVEFIKKMEVKNDQN